MEVPLVGFFSSNPWISFEGISTSNLSDGIVVIHVPEDSKQKVENCICELVARRKIL